MSDKIKESDKKIKISSPIGLMIDNLVYNKHGEIHAIRHSDFHRFLHPDMGGDYGLYAIPLSEEILLKCGFKIGTGKDINESMFDDIFWIDGLFILEHIGEEEGFALYHSDDQDGARLIKWVKYLHKLQNIIYELTDKELEINL